MKLKFGLISVFLCYIQIHGHMISLVTIASRTMNGLRLYQSSWELPGTREIDGLTRKNTLIRCNLLFHGHSAGYGWQPSKQGWVKISHDATISSEFSNVSAGGVTPSPSALLEVWCKPHEGVTDPMIVDTLPLRDGVIIAKLGVSHMRTCGC